MVLLEVVVLSVSVFIIIVTKASNKNPPPVFNVYQRPDGFFWLKVAFMYTVLTLRKLGNKLRKLWCTNSDDYEEFLDRVQPLSIHDNAIDAVYFNGASKNGDHFVIATARRKNRLIDGFFYLLLQDTNLGLLESSKLPSTSLYQSDNDHPDEFCAEGMRIIVLRAMHKWRIQYNGKMRKSQDKSQEVDVFVEAEWSSDLPYFNFDSDMDALSMAKDMAREKWSRDYFQNLKFNHQTHYEQHGDIKGVAIIDEKRYEINLNAMRDHSFGNHREWRNFHRYTLHIATMENGDRMNIGIVSMPIAFSRLSIGYLYKSKEKKMYPVTRCDLELYQHGENGTPPKDYAFTFEAGGSQYTMQVQVLHSPKFYISKDWESVVHERLCTFHINGVRGWGAAEWQYRNVNGKNVPEFNKSI